ncbi:NadS family protein [Trabulsiella odontotermitis]|uniref:NadS family protein n=1 Tax=Trabulsiella odontotermitis TaxID=379893 RepID=UPI0006BA38D6|nr:NadS family protein [Trabulsiella odontotermitis]
MEKRLFDDLLTSVNEMVAIENGECEPAPEHVHRHAIPDVKKLRTSMGMKQSEFAQAVGASVSLVQSWELHRRVPTGIALKVLNLLEKEPRFIEALKSV